MVDIDLGLIALEALRSVVTVFTVLAIGAALALRGHITTADLRFLSTLAGMVLLPALLLKTFGDGPSGDVMLSYAPLVLMGFGTQIFDLLVGIAVTTIFKVQEVWFVRWFHVMMSFSNVVSIPFVLLDSLCNQIEFDDYQAFKDNNETRMLTVTQCIGRGQLYIFMYALMFSFAMWLGAVTYLGGLPTMPSGGWGRPTGEIQNTPETETSEHEEEQIDVSSNAIDENENETKRLDSLDHKRNGSAVEPGSVKIKVVHVDLSIMDIDDNSSNNIGSNAGAGSTNADVNETMREGDTAASVAVVERDVDQLEEYTPKPFTWQNCKQSLRTALLQPAVIVQVIAFIIGFTPKLRYLVFDRSGVLKPFSAATDILSVAVVPVANLALAGTLGTFFKSAGWRQALNPTSVGLSKKTVFLAVFTKMAILPAAHFLIITFVFNQVLQDNRLMRLILYLEGCMPTAILVIVVAHMFRSKRVAEAVALVMVLQYMVSVITMICFVALGLYLSEQVV